MIRGIASICLTPVGRFSRDIDCVPGLIIQKRLQRMRDWHRLRLVSLVLGTELRVYSAISALFLGEIIGSNGSLGPP